MTEFLELDDVLHIIERLGFQVRDAGLLSSAVARPSASVMGADAYPSLEEKAAALLESILRNHALFDGNKRTGWTVMVLFLWINGFQHDFPADDAFDLVIGVAEGRIGLDESARLIAKHRVPGA